MAIQRVQVTVRRWKTSDGKLHERKPDAKEHERYLRVYRPKPLKLLPRLRKSRIVGPWEELVYMNPGNEVCCDVSHPDRRTCYELYARADSAIVEDCRQFKWRRMHNSLYVAAVDPQKVYRYVRKEMDLIETEEDDAPAAR